MFVERRTRISSMLSTCPASTATSAAAVPAAVLAPTPLADVSAPPRARFRRLVVFDGRLA
jgi:hypothetical protein